MLPDSRTSTNRIAIVQRVRGIGRNESETGHPDLKDNGETYEAGRVPRALIARVVAGFLLLVLLLMALQVVGRNFTGLAEGENVDDWDAEW